MTDSRGSGGETGVPNSGSAVFAPFEAWSEWLGNNMGATSAIRGSTGEEAGAEGVTASDPLMSAMQGLPDNPMSNIIPLDWMAISKALQTLHKRQMSDPQRAMQVATDYNQRLLESTMKVWSDTASRFSGLPREEAEEEEEGGKPDKRFSEPEWRSNPHYKMLKETYLLTSEYLLKEAEETDDGQDTEEQRALKFHLKQFVDAMAPVNFFLTNPAAIKRAIETGGMSLTEGARNLASDLEEGRLSMVDANAFEVGGNLATTPGKVVYRNELIELIQYEPQTERVHEVPLLFLPPWINKYYILDLSEKNSFVKYLVEQGFTVFMTSWKNPDSSMEATKFEDYMTLGPLKAVDVIREITGSEKVNPVGYCIGGTLLVMTLAWLAAGDDEKEKQKFGDPTFMVALQDYSEVGDTEVFMDEPQFEAMEMQMMERGYLDDRKMANMFNLLRSSDLIWANVINNYLLGQKPPALDMLYWNADGSRMARDAHSFYIRNTYLENNLIKPGKVELMGRPIDLGRITGDVYSVGAEKDHIVPWKSAWKISKLANTNSTHFTLAASGHIAGMISPPEKSRGYWTGEGQYETADEWRENAEEHEGTWWEDWRGWLEQRSGGQTDAPRVGSDRYPPIEDAPGTYVKETHATHAETASQAGQKGAQAGSQVGQQGAEFAQEGARAAQWAITGVQIEGYDELNVGEVVERLDNLSAEELQRVRAYEQRNKNRSTLLKQIDRRINAAS
jgi:polyhydroxyalkanoate synthase subunit PhaC